jgi:hypothetical protein
VSYAIRTDVRRVVYTRPAVLPAAAPGAATGLDAGAVAYDRAPPVELATIVYYPDAAGTAADPQVVTVARYVATLSVDGTVRRYATLADFQAAVLTPSSVPSLAGLAPATFVAGSPLRWLASAFAAQG